MTSSHHDPISCQWFSRLAAVFHHAFPYSGIPYLTLDYHHFVGPGKSRRGRVPRPGDAGTTQVCMHSDRRRQPARVVRGHVGGPGRGRARCRKRWPDRRGPRGGPAGTDSAFILLIIITHSPEVAAAAHRVIRMRDGRVLER